MTSLDRSRTQISKRVRVLRSARGWTLKDLATRLDVSVSRLSEIERGGGSFTAEQFLVLLRIFNVPASHFVDGQAEPVDRLQAALAQLGAHHLHEPEVTEPIDVLDRYRVIRDALVDGSPRLIAALAPVLVANIVELSGSRLVADAVNAGYVNRLGWVVDSTRAAVDELQKQHREPRLAEASLRLGILADYLGSRDTAYKHFARETAPQLDDVVDRTIRTERGLEQGKQRSSPLARRWQLVTSIQLEDFANALVSARKVAPRAGH